MRTLAQYYNSPKASTPPNGPATTAPQAGTVSSRARPADMSSEPGSFDVAFGFFVFTLFALWSVAWCAVRVVFFALSVRCLGVRRWLAIRRVCAWCKSNLGGNPFAGTTSHGICPCCLAAKKAEAYSYTAAVSPGTKSVNTN